MPETCVYDGVGFDTDCGPFLFPQLFAREPGWDLTSAAAQALGASLKPHRGFIHYRTRSNPTFSETILKGGS